MPAPFALALCGYRPNGKPNTSDASDAFSVELGEALFDAMGVPTGTSAPSGVDKKMSQLLAADLGSRVSGTGLEVLPERPLESFAQFRHIGVLRNFQAEPSPGVTKAVKRLRAFAMRSVTTPPRTVTKRDTLFDELDQALADETAIRRQIIDDLGEESLLGLDVTASRPQATGLPHLEAGFSLKWSLRTDRAQDPRSQGAKMSALRRGRMPHFAAVTMEPRPYMLRILGGGSGEVDVVYHLDLPSLATALEKTTTGRPRRRETRDQFRRLVDQRRLLDYDDLVAYVRTL